MHLPRKPGRFGRTRYPSLSQPKAQNHFFLCHFHHKEAHPHKKTNGDWCASSPHLMLRWRSEVWQRQFLPAKGWLQTSKHPGAWLTHAGLTPQGCCCKISLKGNTQRISIYKLETMNPGKDHHGQATTWWTKRQQGHR